MTLKHDHGVFKLSDLEFVIRFAVHNDMDGTSKYLKERIILIAINLKIIKTVYNKRDLA